ncbi:MAG: glycogen debranching protein GlgX [Paracoccaceae bacterium]|nr:glycogen debranching protein GlgX [Paracoccaceae bacterium]
MKTGEISGGAAAPLGATVTEEGVNFAVFSDNATAMTLCLFDEAGERRIKLPERDGGVWHGHVSGVKPGQLYGYRAHGPYRPDDGHRFNPNKLLIDPYARALTGHPMWTDAAYGYSRGAVAGDLTFDTRDSVDVMPKCIVSDFAPPPANHPRTPWEETIIYEAHPKGLTRLIDGIDAPGTLSALGSAPVIAHLEALGITAIELLPVQAFLDDPFLVEKGLVNYWGYQPWCYFAPDPRYLDGAGPEVFRKTVDRLHEAGIEVLLDVVYNHTGEADHLGPTLAYRGLDNKSYYRLERDNRYYVNDTGTGNTLNLDHPMVLRMVMDSLRYWVEVMGVDGFRFDLCATLGRTGDGGFDRGAAFFDAVRQDPVLTQVKLIAEPWDIGPGGYQLGNFPAPFHEWNDKFRDGARRYWRGDPGRAPDLADRITGSAFIFDKDGRPATSSVNFITAHDGMTLADLTRYSRKHNEANGEGGRDGHSEDFSDSFGEEGPTENEERAAARAQRRRNLLATLFLSQGTPMLLAGDELGNTQNGNNNAYNQDNETTWIDWAAIDEETLEFTRRLIAFRKAHPILSQRLFLHSRERMADGVTDLFWRREDGEPMSSADWNDPARKLFTVEMRTASGTPAYRSLEYAIFMVFNSGPDAEVVLPDAPQGQCWCAHLNTARPSDPPLKRPVPVVQARAHSVKVFVLEPI